METDTALARRCLAAIDLGRRCSLGTDRNRAMAPQPSCGGKSIIDLLWDELLNWYGTLMPPDGEFAGYADNDGGRARVRGVCLGIATSLAFMRNPYRPDVDAIRQELHERWESQCS